MGYLAPCPANYREVEGKQTRNRGGVARNYAMLFERIEPLRAEETVVSVRRTEDRRLAVRCKRVSGGVTRPVGKPLGGISRDL
jgi:hypothetical protein